MTEENVRGKIFARSHGLFLIFSMPNWKIKMRRIKLEKDLIGKGNKMYHFHLTLNKNCPC